MLSHNQVPGQIEKSLNRSMGHGKSLGLDNRFESSGIYCSELDASEANGLVADCDPAFSQEILDIAVTEVESIVEPEGVADDIWRNSVTFVDIDRQILPTWQVDLSVPSEGLGPP